MKNNGANTNNNSVCVAPPIVDGRAFATSCSRMSNLIGLLLRSATRPSGALHKMNLIVDTQLPAGFCYIIADVGMFAHATRGGACGKITLQLNSSRDQRAANQRAISPNWRRFRGRARTSAGCPTVGRQPSTRLSIINRWAAPLGRQRHTASGNPEHASWPRFPHRRAIPSPVRNRATFVSASRTRGAAPAAVRTGENFPPQLFLWQRIVEKKKCTQSKLF